MTTATVKAEKPANYTAEQTERMKTAFGAANTDAERESVVASLALEMGKSIRSIVAKLSREQVYVKKTYTTKQGEKPVKKDETADAIGAVLRLTEPEIESLTKANKTALVKIFAALAMSKPLDGTEPA